MGDAALGDDEANRLQKSAIDSIFSKAKDVVSTAAETTKGYASQATQAITKIIPHHSDPAAAEASAAGAPQGSDPNAAGAPHPPPQ